MSQVLLPPEFADLGPFAASWSLPTERERYAQRLGSSMVEIQAFYDATFPRGEEAIRYCEKFSIDELPEDALRLLHLLYSLVTVSFCVEAWSQPNVPDSGAAYLDLVVEPTP